MGASSLSLPSGLMLTSFLIALLLVDKEVAGVVDWAIEGERPRVGMEGEEMEGGVYENGGGLREGLRAPVIVCRTVETSFLSAAKF